MTRISKKEEIRSKSPKKRHFKLTKKTGSLKDHLPLGYKEHKNALEGQNNSITFIAKVKSHV